MRRRGNDCGYFVIGSRISQCASDLKSEGIEKALVHNGCIGPRTAERIIVHEYYGPAAFLDEVNECQLLSACQWRTNRVTARLHSV